MKNLDMTVTKAKTKDQTKCLKCGDCCKSFSLYVNPFRDEEGKYLAKIFGINRAHIYKIKIKHQCQQLTEENLCSIYNSKTIKRPEVCIGFKCYE